MATPFSRIEREVLVRYLEGELPELHIDTGKKRFMIPAGTYAQEQSSLVFSAVSFGAAKPESRLPVKVTFYYNKRGLFFVSRLVQADGKILIEIPSDIFKITEDAASPGGDFAASVTFQVNNAQVEIPCETVPDLPLFKPDTWNVPGRVTGSSFAAFLEKNCGARKSVVPAEFAHFLSARGKLFEISGAYGAAQKNPPPFDAFITEREAGFAPSFVQILKDSLPAGVYASIDGVRQNTVCFPPAALQFFMEAVPSCIYLDLISQTDAAIQGKAEPLVLAYISDERLILGGAHNTFPFKPGFTFVFSARFGVRSVGLHCSTDRIIPGNNRSCAVCSFTRMKLEDTRFLYEKIYKKRFV